MESTHLLPVKDFLTWSLSQVLIYSQEVTCSVTNTSTSATISTDNNGTVPMVHYKDITRPWVFQSSLGIVNLRESSSFLKNVEFETLTETCWTNSTKFGSLRDCSRLPRSRAFADSTVNFIQQSAAIFNNLQHSFRHKQMSQQIQTNVRTAFNEYWVIPNSDAVLGVRSDLLVQACWSWSSWTSLEILPRKEAQDALHYESSRVCNTKAAYTVY